MSFPEDELRGHMFTKIRSFLFEFSFVNRLLRGLTDEQFISLHYFVIKGKMANLRHPRGFTEKIQWIKIYGGIEKYTQYVDKFEVRVYVKKTIGEKYLIPLFGVWDSFDEIPFDRLPNAFILKSTNGSGSNFICKDKSSLDKKAVRKVINTWMHENFYLKTREAQYKYCKTRIIGEHYLDEGPGGLTDFKFYCKNGEPQLVDVIANRLRNLTLEIFDLHFVRLPIFSSHPKAEITIEKPSNFQEMIDISRKLAAPFSFVRVDLYSFEGNVYFGELTFTPGNGLGQFNSQAADRQLGEVIDISSFKQN